MNGEKVSFSMMLGGSGTAAYFAWPDLVGMLGGLLIGIAGLGLTWYYQRQRNKREQERHERDMGWVGQKDAS